MTNKCFQAAGTLRANETPLQLRSHKLMPKNVRHVLLPPEDFPNLATGRNAVGMGKFIKTILTGRDTSVERGRLLTHRERAKNRRRALIFLSSADRVVRLQATRGGGGREAGGRRKGGRREGEGRHG